MKSDDPAATRFDWRAQMAARPVLWIVVGATVLASLARLFALTYAPRYSYAPDHADFMAWSLEAYDNGPANIYKRVNRPGQGRPWLVNYRFYLAAPPYYIDGPRAIPHACNYPPLSTYVFWTQGALWRLLADDVTIEARPTKQGLVVRREAGGETTDLLVETPKARALGLWPGRVENQPVANTFAARFVGALPSVVFDFVLAWGVASVVRRLSDRRRWTTREAVAFGLTLLAPPVILDSAFWNQADSWIAALLVWTLAMLISRRWLPAGLIFGAALLVKPQAILFAPVLAFIIAAQRLRSGGSWRGLIGPIIATGVALAAAGVLSLPHTLAGVGENARPARESAAGKPARAISSWFDIVYGELVFGQSYPRTTFNAFNVWWFHYLGNYRNPAALDPTAPAALGLSKDAFGKLMLAAFIVATWLLAGRKWGWSETSWLAVAALVTLAAFGLPTRVHERYIYLCIPFFIALTTLRPIWSLVLVPLLVVGTFEMTSFRWAGALQSAAVRNSSALLAALTCLALVLSLALLIRRARPQSAPQS